ncbi:hypothetical protein MJ575_14170 [Klebsiella pneumoniae]|nr:hypothetical protein MJ575_14170 [Klebsiella pneumoniae]
MFQRVNSVCEQRDALALGRNSIVSDPLTVATFVRQATRLPEQRAALRTLVPAAAPQVGCWRLRGGKKRRLVVDYRHPTGWPGR